VAVGIVALDAVTQPEKFRNAQKIAKVTLESRPFLRGGIAIGIKQQLLGW